MTKEEEDIINKYLQLLDIKSYMRLQEELKAVKSGHILDTNCPGGHILDTRF